MASSGGRINFQVGFNVDKSGLNQLKSSLQEIQKIKPGDFNLATKELREVQKTAKKVQEALTQAFNVNLGSLNINQFNQLLRKSGLTVNTVYRDFSKLGAQGQIAFNQMSTSLLTTNLQLKQTNSLVSKMGTTMMNTLKWTFSSSLIQQFTNGIRQAFQYVEALDASLTDIRIVTGDSTEQMRQFAQQANKAAQALGRSTMDYTKAALTFYQQGLDDQSVAARTQATLQAQNITGAGDEMADYLTAVWNGYKVANEQAQLYVDRLAAVADSSASNMAQLATAMSKVAATANAMGVDVNQLNAQIATIIATTRQAPQTVGNALKTIFARINDIQAGTEDAEVSLGHYTGAMAELGINVLDTSGHLRDTGQVMEEIGQKWQTMSREQQIYLARTMAGQRQYNNLIALFDNWGRYTELVNVSMDSQGTLMEKNARYMDSLGAKMQQLGAAGEKVKDAIMNEEDMKGMVGFAAGAVNVFGNFIESIGGARGALLGLASIMTSVFSGVISKEINSAVSYFQNLRSNLRIIQNDINQTFTMAASQGYDKGTIKEIVDAKMQLASIYGVMSSEQINNYNNLVKQLGQEKNRKIALDDSVDSAKKLEQTFEQMAAKSKMNVSDVSQNAAGSIQVLKQTLEKVKDTSGLETLKNQIQQTIKAMGGGQGVPAVERFNEAIKKMQAGTLSGANAVGRLSQIGQELYNVFGKQWNDYANLQTLEFQAKNAAQRVQNLKDQLDSIAQGKQQLFDIQNAVNFVGAIGRVSSGITSLVNLTRIWKNENLSTGQKVLQTFTNLGFTIPMIFSAMNSLKKVFMQTSTARQLLLNRELAQAKAQLAKYDEQIAKERALEAATVHRIEAEAAARAAAAKQGAATKRLKKAESKYLQALEGDDEGQVKAAKQLIDAQAAQEDAAAQNNLAQAKKKVAIESQKEADQAVKNAGANLAEGGSAEKAAGDNEILSLSLKQVAVDAAAALLPLLPFIIAAGAAAAAIYVFYKQWNSANETAENAAKQVAQAKERYDQLKQAFEDLKSSFEEYDSIKNSLSDLTRGTQEWRDALLEANDVVLQLLSTYPQLASQIGHDENGMLTLSQEARDNLLNSQRQQMIAARGASIVATINSRDAATMARAASIGQHTQGAAFVNETGLIDFTGSPQLVASIARHVAEGIIDTKTLQQLTGADEQFINALLQNTDQLAALGQVGQELISNQDAARLNYQTMANQALADQNAYKGLTQAERDVADAVIGLDLEKRVDEIKASLQQTELGITRFTTGSNETLQNLLTRYMEGTGAQGLRWRSNAVTSESGQLVFHLTDTEGNDLDLTQDLFNNTIAVAEALQKIGENSLQTVNQMLNAISNFNSQTASDAMQRLLTNQDFGNLTRAQLESFDRENISEDLSNFFEDYYSQAGYDSASAFEDAFFDRAQAGVARFQSIGQTYLAEVQSVVSRSAFDDLSLSATENIAEALNEAFIHGGTRGLNSLESILTELDSDDLQEFSSLLSNVDWSSSDAVYQLTHAVEQAEIAIDTTSQAWQSYIQWINNTANAAINAINPLERLRNLINSFQEISDISTGDIIDAQTYQNLIKQAPEIAQLFMQGANGYMFVGFQQDVYSILDGNTDRLINNFNAAKAAADDLLRNDVSGRFQGIELGTIGQDYSLHHNTEDILGSLLTEDQAFDNALTYMGVDRQSFNRAVQWLLNNQQSSMHHLTQQQRAMYDEQLRFIQGTLDDITALQAGAQNGDFTDERLGEMIAVQASQQVHAITQLRQAYQQGQITAQIYSRARSAAIAKEIEELDITREAYDEMYSVVDDHLHQVSNSFNDLSQAEQQIQVDQLTTEIFQLGQALDELTEISSDSFQLIQQHLNGIETANSAQAIAELQQKLTNIFNVPIDTDFIAQNFDLIQRLAYGDITALDQLQIALAQDYVADLRLQTDNAVVQSQLDDISNMIANFPIQDMQVGMSLDDSEFARSLVDAAVIAGMGADDINHILQSIGFEPEVTEQVLPFDQSNLSLHDNQYTYDYFNPVSQQWEHYPVSTHQIDGALSTGQITIPIINGKKIKWNGGSRAAQISRPNYSDINRPSGGGGGKGSGSTAKPSVQKSSQDQRDPYHDINRLLDKQKEKLDNIQKQDKKLVNRDRLNNINAQNKALEEQANLLENKLAIAESQEIRLRNQLLADTNGYAQFGANGQITNFNQMLANAEKQYNDYIAYYNTLSKQQQDAEKDRLDLEKERYQRVKKTADEYEETLDLQRDLLEQINENQEKQYENLIKQSKIRVDLAVDTGDLEREYLDFENKFIKKLDKDDFLENAKANVKELMSYFNSDQIKKRNEEINSLNAIIQRIEKNGGGAYVDPSTGYNLAAAQERLSELFKDQTKALEEIDDLVKEIQEIYLDSLKDAKDKMDDQIDQYERVGELIEHNAKLAQLIYGDKAYASLEKYYALQQRNDQRILNNLRMQQQYWQSQLDNEVVGSDAWLEIKKNLDDITDDLNNKLEDMIDRLADQWQVRAKKITDQVNNSMTGGRGLDYLNEQWDYISDYDDNFLDTLESKFGIQQVETLYQQAIDSIQGDPRGQQRLNKLMNDQLKLLRQKDKLTEYDVERAKAALEVEKARMAIEQARDSKTKMRLRRDSQGNYTYQYVADENKLSDLQQALNEAQANLYNMDKQHYTQNLNSISDAYQEFQQKMLKLQFEYAQADAANNEEEKKRVNDRIELLKDSYNKLFDGLTEDNQYNLKYLAQSFGQGMGFTKAQQEAEDFIKIMEQNIPHVGGEVQNLTNAIIADGGLLSALSELENGFVASNLQYVAGVQTYLAETGTTVDAIMQVTDAYGNVMDTAIGKAQEFIPYYDSMIEKSVGAIDKIRETIESVEQILDKNLDDSALVKTLETAVNLLQDLNRYKNALTGQVAKDVNIVSPDVVSRNIDTTENNAGIITAQDWKNYLNNQSTSQPITFANINAIGQLDADTLNSLSNEDVLLNVVGTIKYLTDSMGAMVNQQIGSMIKEASSYIGNIENVEKLDQNVHIEANFPNVIQAEEIKAAFNNLVNMAAQTAYKPNTT